MNVPPPPPADGLILLEGDVLLLGETDADAETLGDVEALAESDGDLELLGETDAEGDTEALADTDGDVEAEGETEALALLMISRTAKCTMARSSEVPEERPTFRAPWPAVVSVTTAAPLLPKSIDWRRVLPVPAVGSVCRPV